MICRSLIWVTIIGLVIAMGVPFALSWTRADNDLGGAPEDAAEAELQEIWRIRQELEDLDPLRGTRFSESAKNAEAKPQRTTDRPPHGDASPFLQALRRVKASSQPVENKRVLENPEHRSGRTPADADRRLVEALRRSARLLDGKAADLEDAGRYRKADRLRQLAGRLRRQARELAPADASEQHGDVDSSMNRRSE